MYSYMPEDNLDTAYVNHAWSESEWNPVTAALYKNEIAAVHFSDYPLSLDSEEWEAHVSSHKANSIGRLSEYKKDGQILAVSYTNHPDLSGGRYVGAVGPADTDIDSENQEMLILVCKLGDEIETDNAIVDMISVPIGATEAHIKNRIDQLEGQALDYVQAVLEEEDEPEDRFTEYYILKGFKLTDPVWVWNQDFPGLWAANKRSTIMGWNKGDQHLYAAYYRAVEQRTTLDRVDDVYDIIDRKKSAVWALSQGQLEALCGEYLRRNYENYVELISAGGSLPDADIFAATEDDALEILAQVTFETDTEKVKKKMRNLLAYETDNQTVDFWFFGPDETEEELPSSISGTDVGEVYKPIEQVYNEFEEDLSPEFLDMLLKIELTPGKPDI